MILRIADWLENWAERLRDWHWARWHRKHPAPVSTIAKFIPEIWDDAMKQVIDFERQCPKEGE